MTHAAAEKRMRHAAAAGKFGVGGQKVSRVMGQRSTIQEAQANIRGANAEETVLGILVSRQRLKATLRHQSICLETWVCWFVMDESTTQLTAPSKKAAVTCLYVALRTRWGPTPRDYWCTDDQEPWWFRNVSEDLAFAARLRQRDGKTIMRPEPKKRTGWRSSLFAWLLLRSIG